MGRSYSQNGIKYDCLGIDGRTLLEWTLKKWVSMRGIALIQLRIGIIGEPL